MTTLLKQTERDLTNSQLFIWLGQQLKPRSPLYNTVFTFEIKEEISVPHFQLAFQALLGQSDTLRTVFFEQNGVPRQKVQPHLFYQMEFIDKSGHSARTDIQNWIGEQSKLMLDLSQRCFDVKLIKLSDERFIWFTNLHHIISDGWSITIFFKSMMDCYRRALKDTLNDAPRLPQFLEFISYCETVQSEKSWQDAKCYWQEKQKQLPVIPKLYGQTNWSEGTNSRRITIDLGAQRTNRLRELALQAGIRNFTPDLTYFNIFTALAFIYVYRVSAQKELAIGVPTHNRTTPGFKNTIGSFIELFPLWTTLDDADTFLHVIEKARLEGNTFLRKAGTGTSSAELHRSFNVICNYINADFITDEEHSVEATWVHPDHLDPGHHLRLEIHDFNRTGTFKIDFDFNSHVIPESKQEIAIGHFMKLLDAFLSDTALPIGSIDILSETEKAQILQYGNSGQAFQRRTETILDRFDQQLANDRHAIAVVDEERSISYQELDRRSNQLAHLLRQRGLQQEEVVGLFLDRSVDLIIGIMAILKAGGAYMPMDAIYPEERLSRMLENSGASLVVSRRGFKDKIDFFRGSFILMDQHESIIDQQSIDRPQLELTGANLAYVIYTSGSTGQPKGCQVEHRNVISLVDGLEASIYHRYEGRLRVALVAPCVFDPSVQQIFAALLLGHTLYIVPECYRLDGIGLHRFLIDNQIDVTDGTPTHLRLLLQAPKSRELPRHFIIGGEALPAALVGRFQKHFKGAQAIITNIYGVAECGVDSVAFDVDLNELLTDQLEIPIGHPLPGQSVYIMNGRKQLMPVGVPGELHLGGNNVGRGYLNQPDLTRERFLDHPFGENGSNIYATGDVAKFLPDGQVQFIGRIDNQVKIRGYRVELGEIAHHLRQFELDNRAVAIPPAPSQKVRRCKQCLLSENYPGVHFDQEGVCNTCHQFDTYQEKALQYFRTPSDLAQLMTEAKQHNNSDYDCMLLYSGGKDSSYVLYRLVEMGLKVLAFTFDNGFISKAAFDNIKRQTDKLGVDSIISTTEYMDEIFIESLNSDSTVCSGCFKSLTAISTQLAEEKGINVIVTGLSRGQIFDTKLAGLYEEGIRDLPAIEERLLLFRQMFHASDDRTNRLLGIDLSQVAFESMYFIDFFRYDHTPVQEIKAYLADRDSFWSQPKDTGFCSSNCLMNDIGICVHSGTKGYHNYEAPLSWDIRLNISTREEVLPEVEGAVNTRQVENVLKRIGFFAKEIREAVVLDRTDNNGDTYLCAYFVANHKLSVSEIRNFLREKLPGYMIPAQFVQLERMPVTVNGKIDYRALPEPSLSRPMMDVGYVAPQNEFEEIIAGVWQEVLEIGKIGVHDQFLDLGGNSLKAIQMVSRLNSALDLQMMPNIIFEKPTVAALAVQVEATIVELLNELEE